VDPVRFDTLAKSLSAPGQLTFCEGGMVPVRACYTALTLGAAARQRSGGNGG
jgi:hypothetical protein